MKNLKIYDKSTFDFHLQGISLKKDVNLKNRISALNPEIQEKFNEFDERFTNNTLQEIDALSHTNEQKVDLRRLYRYKSKLIGNLKEYYTISDDRRRYNTCPNCTINEIDSFDHSLPQSEFAEFVINPKNLFPSCTSCNRYKNDVWREGGQRKFLNLFIDTLPVEQYLFVDINAESTIPGITFRIDNSHGINPNLFTLIESHYTRLHLLSRFRENCGETVYQLEEMIKSFGNKIGLNEIRESVIMESDNLKPIYGHNYWKSVLKVSLVNNIDFMSRFSL